MKNLSLNEVVVLTSFTFGESIQVAADNDTITFNKSLTISVPGSSQLTLDGNIQNQIFILSDDSPTNTINISGMTMWRRGNPQLGISDDE